ncbi:cellulose binding domain-containing protein [Solwaraspora sp. WMMA2056]|uniref:cellulose binding domain-containing protein n=1 Tax=Solwaraspora sp. WMMA2056 TaxID=3015161 RepID=UPI00259B1C05|nr:cellulose binding domain-containing protein [Solwaraspora sp. WMMA2056]WJK43707.1 cellulose binding domain-containing protein [Solwaraspora sp. WMMA2056]
MNKLRSFWTRVGALTVALLVGTATVGFAPTAAHAAIAHFAKEGEWSTGYVGKLTVHNNAPVPITSWRVDLELPAGTSISSHWNAQLTRVGTRYVFRISAGTAPSPPAPRPASAGSHPASAAPCTA